jgi:dihydroorotase
LGQGVASNAGLSAGAVADLCIFNPDQAWRPGPQTLVSAGGNGPVLERPMPGVVHYTLVAGHKVWPSLVP